jgi:hypothetical protein
VLDLLLHRDPLVIPIHSTETSGRMGDRSNLASHWGSVLNHFIELLASERCAAPPDASPAFRDPISQGEKLSAVDGQCPALPQKAIFSIFLIWFRRHIIHIIAGMTWPGEPQSAIRGNKMAKEISAQ